MRCSSYRSPANNGSRKGNRQIGFLSDVTSHCHENTFFKRSNNNSTLLGWGRGKKSSFNLGNVWLFWVWSSAQIPNSLLIHYLKNQKSLIGLQITPIVASTAQRKKMNNEFCLYRVLEGCCGNPKITRTKFHDQGKWNK